MDSKVIRSPDLHNHPIALVVRESGYPMPAMLKIRFHFKFHSGAGNYKRHYSRRAFITTDVLFLFEFDRLPNRATQNGTHSLDSNPITIMITNALGSAVGPQLEKPGFTALAVICQAHKCIAIYMFEFRHGVTEVDLA